MNGILTDRTAEFATASSVPGDNGFLTPTNDRDVYLIDLDLDGWLDMITAVTISDSDPKYIGHPRIYMNLCCEVGGCEATSCDEDDWRGPAQGLWKLLLEPALSAGLLDAVGGLYLVPQGVPCAPRFSRRTHPRRTGRCWNSWWRRKRRPGRQRQPL